MKIQKILRYKTSHKMNSTVFLAKVILMAVIFGILLLFPAQVLTDISGPPRIIRAVGQDAVFMWNMTNHIHFLVLSWGLLNTGFDFQARFIRIGYNGRPSFSDDLNSHASRYKGRVDFVGDVRAGYAWFKLSNLTLNDTGRYSVKAEAELFLEEFFNMATATYLIVTAPPTFLSSLQKYHYIQEGADITIHCSAIGPPTPNVTWFHVVSDTMVTKSSGVGSASLRIPEIIRDHSGMYECQAINNPNEWPSAIYTNIVVMYKPKIVEHNFTRNATCNTRTILLYCVADGVPFPHVLWFKPDGYSITTGFKAIPRGSVLKVVTRSNEDYGKYRCRTENILGSDEHVFDVANEYINGSNKTCDSINKEKKENTSSTESKTCVSAIAVCVSIIVLLVILNVIKFVITRKKPKAEEIEMDERKKRSKGADKQTYENVVEMSGGASTSGRQLEDVVYEQQQDNRERFNRDKESPTTFKTRRGDGLANDQEEMDKHIYTSLANRDDQSVYQELSFKTGIKKKK